MALSLATVLMLSDDIQVANILLAFVRVEPSFHKMASCSPMNIEVAQALLDIDVLELLWNDVEVHICLPGVV